MVQPEQLVEAEWAEWYRLTPIQRWLMRSDFIAFSMDYYRFFSLGSSDVRNRKALPFG
jgi:hypothetical protein